MAAGEPGALLLPDDHGNHENRLDKLRWLEVLRYINTLVAEGDARIELSLDRSGRLREASLMPSPRHKISPRGPRSSGRG